jgi:hypothetical protein
VTVSFSTGILLRVVRYFCYVQGSNYEDTALSDMTSCDFVTNVSGGSAPSISGVKEEIYSTTLKMERRGIVG